MRKPFFENHTAMTATAFVVFAIAIVSTVRVSAFGEPNPMPPMNPTTCDMAVMSKTSQLKSLEDQRNALLIEKNSLLNFDEPEAPPAQGSSYDPANFGNIEQQLAALDAQACLLVQELEGNACVNPALLTPFVFCLAQQLAQPPNDATLRVTLMVPANHQGPIEVMIDFGTPNARQMRVNPDQPIVEIPVPAGLHTVDIRPINPANGLPTFRVQVGGAFTRMQASPHPIQFAAGQTVDVSVQDPILQMTNPLTLQGADAGQQNATVTVQPSGAVFFPYLIEIRRSGNNQLVRTFRSRLDGSAPVIAPADASLPPDTYLILVMPVRMHYPVTSYVRIRGGGNVATSRRIHNRAPTPVTVVAGQTIEIVVEEGTESYNQTIWNLNGINFNLIFTGPYLHFNNERTTNPRYQPTINEATPNTLTEFMQLGSTVMMHDLAEEAARGMLADANLVDNVRWEYRVHRVVVLFDLDANGRIPATFRTMTESDLTELLYQHFMTKFDKVMRKPHRTSDAMSIQTIMRDTELPNMTPADRLLYEPVIRPAGMELHYHKHQSVTDFGQFYLARWLQL